MQNDAPPQDTNPGDNRAIPVLGIVAWSGSGKTSLLTAIIPLLKHQGLRIAVIKHSHHDFQIDQPGKDSHRIRAAGADQVMLASAYRQAWIREGDGQTEPRLDDLLALLSGQPLDLILFEGFRGEPLPKIEVYRPELGKPALYPHDPYIIAVASNVEYHSSPPPRLLPLDNVREIANFIVDWLSNHQ